MSITGKKLLDLRGARVPAQLRKGRGQRLRLTFDGPELVVVTPSGEFTEAAREFVAQKEAWIVKHYLRLREHDDALSETRARLQSEVLLEGQWRGLRIVEGTRPGWRLTEDALQVARSPRQRDLRPQDLACAALRALAKERLTRRAEHWSERTGLLYNRLFIKGQRTKWGSCSAKKNVNLNWRLVMLPPELADYVVVHELAHLREMNHGPRFWAIVGQYAPDYRDNIAQLKARQWVIGAYDE